MAEALASAGAAIAPVLDSGAALASAAGDAITAAIPPIVSESYTTVTGGEYSVFKFLWDFGPLLYCTLLPFLCFFFCGMCGLCSGSKKKTGNRVLKQVNLALKAEKLKSMKGLSPSPKKLTPPKGKEYVGVTSLSDAEKGKAGSPIKNKAAMRGCLLSCLGRAPSIGSLRACGFARAP